MSWMQGRELSYVNDHDPIWKRLFIALLEDLSGRRRVLPLYQRWRESITSVDKQGWDTLLAQIGTRLDVEAPPQFPHAISGPLLMVANHPFGIPDGIVLMALAERIGRPYRILVHSDLMRIPELAAVALPVDFATTRSATSTNLRTRAAARALLEIGGTIIIFPAGGVATAGGIFGKAEELAWKPFAARLLRRTGACVLPIFIEGQNSPMFQLASQIDATLRLALIVSEARRQIGTTITLRIGAPIAASELQDSVDDQELIGELYRRVQRLKGPLA